MSDNENLIDQLTNDLKPIKGKPGHNCKAICLWLFFSTVGTIAFTYLMGPFRPNSVHEFMDNPLFIAEVSSAVLLVIFSVKTAFDLSIPSGKRLVKHLFWPLSFFILWLCLFIYSSLTVDGHVGHANEEHHRAKCYLEVLVYSLIPIIAGALWMNTQWLYHRVIAAVILGLAAGVIPATVMQFACKSEALHSLYFHVIPGIVCALMGLLIAFLIIKKR